MMGYQAPRIDRIAKKSVEFTDYHGHTRIPERTCWNFRASKVVPLVVLLSLAALFCYVTA